jgi:molecular chaperone GrpE
MMTKQTTNDTQIHQDEGAEEQQDQSFDGLYTDDPAGLDKMSLDEALERLNAAEISMASHQTDVLRLHADMQNLRRRADQDVEKAHKYGQERLVSELLPVMDNLERALQVAGEQENELLSALRQGVELTLKSFVGCLNKFNVQAVDPVGEPFDPQFHQAMGMQESTTAEPNTVIAVMQKGYTLNGRVLRPAMVMVSRAPSEAGDGKA